MREFGLVGKFLPAIADVYTTALQTEQHGGGVLRVDIQIGLRHGQLRGWITKLAVVQDQNASRFTTLQMKQRGMPPEMVAQIV